MHAAQIDRQFAWLKRTAEVQRTPLKWWTTRQTKFLISNLLLWIDWSNSLLEDLERSQRCLGEHSNLSCHLPQSPLTPCMCVAAGWERWFWSQELRKENCGCPSLGKIQTRQEIGNAEDSGLRTASRDERVNWWTQCAAVQCASETPCIHSTVIRLFQTHALLTPWSVTKILSLVCVGVGT